MTLTGDSVNGAEGLEVGVDEGAIVVDETVLISVGDTVGEFVGAAVVAALGVAVGNCLPNVGTIVGLIGISTIAGAKVGAKVGVALGTAVGVLPIIGESVIRERRDSASGKAGDWAASRYSPLPFLPINLFLYVACGLLGFCSPFP